MYFEILEEIVPHDELLDILPGKSYLLALTPFTKFGKGFAAENINIYIHKLYT